MWLVRKQYFELLNDFYALTFLEKDTFNFGLSLGILQNLDVVHVRIAFRFTYHESAFNHFKISVLMQDVHVAWTAINRIDCELHIILTSTASDRNTGCFIVQKMSKKVARWHSSHFGFLSRVEPLQCHGIFHSIGKSDINGWNFSKRSHLINLNQGQDCSKNIFKKLYL